jgi:protein subunit release factor A
VYSDFEIDSNIQVSEADIYALENVQSESALKTRIDTIKDKFRQIEKAMVDMQGVIVQKYEVEFKELLQREEKAKEKQMETLKFFKDSGFDLIPKDISNKLINELQSNSMSIP